MHALAAFSDLLWQPGLHPLERKKECGGGLTLLELAPGFSDPNWCRRSHILFVLEGTLTLELEGEVITLQAGNAFWLAEDTRHRAANRGTVPTVLFLASDWRPPAAS